MQPVTPGPAPITRTPSLSRQASYRKVQSLTDDGSGLFQVPVTDQTSFIPAPPVAPASILAVDPVDAATAAPTSLADQVTALFLSLGYPRDLLQQAVLETAPPVEDGSQAIGARLNAVLDWFKILYLPLDRYSGGPEIWFLFFGLEFILDCCL